MSTNTAIINRSRIENDPGLYTLWIASNILKTPMPFQIRVQFYSHIITAHPTRRNRDCAFRYDFTKKRYMVSFHYPYQHNGTWVAIPGNPAYYLARLAHETESTENTQRLRKGGAVISHVDLIFLRKQWLAPPNARIDDEYTKLYSVFDSSSKYPANIHHNIVNGRRTNLEMHPTRQKKKLKRNLNTMLYGK